LTIFNCLHCGCCCRNLRVYLDDTEIKQLGKYQVGLMLLPEETKLFSPADIAPMWGIDTKGKRRPNRPKTLIYQMTRYTCPHLSKENRCLIYKHRPTICRGYPLTIHVNMTATLDLKCTSCHKQNLYDTTHQLYKVFPEELIQSQVQLHKRMKQFFMSEDYKHAYLFDLKTDTWKQLTQKDLEAMEPHPHDKPL